MPRKLTTQKFIEKANLVHNNYYDYSLVDYINSQTKIQIICPTHGIFEQKPNNHLLGRKCLKCSIENSRHLLEDIVKKCNIIHNNKYSYIDIKFEKRRVKLIIKCPVHGIFEQRKDAHLHGYGCIKCSKIWSKGEKEVLEYVKSIYSGIILENDRTIIKPKELDIYLPDLKISIEYNGEYWHDKREKESPGYHQLKEDLCKQQNIKLITLMDSSWNNNKKLSKEILLNTLHNV